MDKDHNPEVSPTTGSQQTIDPKPDQINVTGEEGKEAELVSPIIITGDVNTDPKPDTSAVNALDPTHELKDPISAHSQVGRADRASHVFTQEEQGAIPPEEVPGHLSRIAREAASDNLNAETLPVETQQKLPRKGLLARLKEILPH